MADVGYAAFVSYGHGDAEWVHALAGNLERLGLHVFLDAWELVAGDLIAVRLQKGLAAAGVVVFVVSAESVDRGWGQRGIRCGRGGRGRERAAATDPGDAAEEVALPPLVASPVCMWTSAMLMARRLMRGRRSVSWRRRSAVSSGSVPPGTWRGHRIAAGRLYRAEGPRLARLRITRG